MLAQRPTPSTSVPNTREAELQKNRLTFGELAARFPAIAKDRQAIEITIKQLSNRFKTIAPETVEQVYLNGLCAILETKPKVLLFLPVLSIRAAIDELCKLQPAGEKPASVQYAHNSLAQGPSAPYSESRTRKFFRRLLSFTKRPPIAEAPSA